MLIVFRISVISLSSGAKSLNRMMISNILASGDSFYLGGRVVVYCAFRDCLCVYSPDS